MSAAPIRVRLTLYVEDGAQLHRELQGLSGRARARRLKQLIRDGLRPAAPSAPAFALSPPPLPASALERLGLDPAELSFVQDAGPRP